MPALQLRMSSNIGRASDYHTSTSPDAIAAISTCLFLIVLAVCLRVFTKVVDFRRVQLEDYVILIAGSGLIAFVGLLFSSARTGLGHEYLNLTFDETKRALQQSNALDVLFALVMFTVKLAILIELDRMLAGSKKKVIYWGVRVLILVNAIYYMAAFFLSIFVCNPANKLDGSEISKTCIPRTTTALTGSIDIVSNVVILLFVVWGVSLLNLTMRLNVVIILLLALGSFACAASMCRLIYGIRIDINGDITDDLWAVQLWSLAELTSIILCGCCPTFPRLYRYTQGERSSTHSQWPRKRNSCSGIPLVDLKMSKSHDTSLSPSRKATPDMPHRSSSQNSGGKISTSVYEGISNNHLSNTPRNASPAPIETQKTLPRAPIRHISNVQRQPLEIIYSDTVLPTQTRPISLSSYPNYLANFPMTPSSPTQSHFNMPSSPVSPAQTEFSIAQTEFSAAEFQDATPMRILPVYFATIKKTISIRISSHTNLGSPMSWRRKPSFGW